MLTPTAARNAYAAYAKTRQERRTRRAMLELNDHLLRDIGLTRNDIVTSIR